MRLNSRTPRRGREVVASGEAKPHSPTMRLWPYLALTLAGVTWGVGFPLAELALPEIAPAPLLLLRFLVACAVCLPLALRTREGRAAFRDPWIWIAGGVYGASFLLQFEGLARSSVTLAALMVGVLPALIALASPLLGERVAPAAWVGVVSATLGAGLIAARPGTAGSPFGIVLLAASMLAYLVWFLASRRTRPNVDLLAPPCAMVVTTTLALAAMVLPLHGPPSLHLSLRAWSGIVGSGLLCTAVATTAWQVGAARTSGATAGVFVNLEPVIGACCGVLLFGDRLTPAIAGGGVLIVAGSVVAVLSDARRAPTAAVVPIVLPSGRT